MAGVYIHIPFCKQLCYYCDFHFSLSLRFKDEMVAAILLELEQRKSYLSSEKITTIYFGGGTPSVLNLDDIEIILAKVYALYDIDCNPEITIEANPDDLTPSYLKGLKKVGVNRLSIGIQSFHDNELKLMNRRHTAAEALACVQDAIEFGFENMTVDLIYGLPDSTLNSWQDSLEIALRLPIKHFSCYHLGVEEKTAFANFKKKGTLREVSEDNSWQQYELLCQRMREEAYEHYEISNFARNGWHSQHNSAYWNGTPYIGIGPSAHSFDGKNRQWNISHNKHYLEAISRGTSYFDVEKLSDNEKFNDFLITQLRTAKGVLYEQLSHTFPKHYSIFEQGIRKYIGTDLADSFGKSFQLTEKGMFQSDAIIADLLAID